MTEKFKVVISGMSGRFPECDDIGTFREKLYNGDEFITIDNRKWPVGYKCNLKEKVIPDATGKYTNIHNLDHTVFRLNKLFAVSTDIINRKPLEPAFEAIVDAGINPYSLNNRNIGVFMSVSMNETEYGTLQDNRDVLSLIGSSKTMLSNRISFTFNFTGPSFTNHVDFHGGLESLALGYKYVSEGFVEAAVVGVASSIVDPSISSLLLPFGLLSPDGVTRVFDKYANGYGRSEATVVFYLQRSENAKRNYGHIKFCDTFYYGSITKSSIVGYDEEHLKTSLRAIHDAQKYSPDQDEIAYIEMNAYGIKRSESIESNVVAEIFKKEGKSLLVGSIKSNVGHSGAASAYLSIMKCIFALESDVVAPNLHLKEVNTDIRAFRENKLKVVTTPSQLPGNLIAINCIGLCGTVSQALIQQNSKKPKQKSENENPLPRLLLICGRVEAHLIKTIERIENQPFNAEFVALANDAFIADMPMHVYRGFTILPKLFKAVHSVQEKGDNTRATWFIFSGMGSQWNGMGKGLLNLPIFARTVAKCDEVLKRKGIDIYNILLSDDPSIFDDILNSFVGIITIQIGLCEVLKSLHIEPHGIIGHSVGENGCAYADGCLTLEQAVLASWARGIASKEADTIQGMMAAVGMGFSVIKNSLPDGVEVACHNSSDNCTISGPAELVNTYVAELQQKGIFAKAVNVANIAYHSKYIAMAGPKLLSRLKQVIPVPRKRSLKWISTSVPETKWTSSLANYCSAEYLTNNLLSPVLFEEACKHIPSKAIIIEISPHGLLQAILKRSLPETCTNISLTFRSKTKENFNFLLSSIGQMYIAGLEPYVNNLYPQLEFPVPRGTPPVAPLCTWYHDENDIMPEHLKLKERTRLSDEKIIVSIKEDSEYGYLRFHKIGNNTVIPPSFFMYLTWWILSYKQNMKTLDSIIFEDIRVLVDVTISQESPKYFSIMIQYGSGFFEIHLENKNKDSIIVVMTGRIQLSKIGKTQFNVNVPGDCELQVDGETFYESFKNVGYKIGDAFTLLQKYFPSTNGREYDAEIRWNGNWVAFLDTLMKFQMFVDQSEKASLLYVTRIRRLEICFLDLSKLAKEYATLLCHVDLKSKLLLCEGVQMQDLEYKVASKDDLQTDARIRGYNFVSHENPYCRNAAEFVNFCLQLAIQSLPKAGIRDNNSKLRIIDTTNEFSEVVKNIIKYDHFVRSNASFSSTRESIAENSSSSVLIITNKPEEIITLKMDQLFVLASLPLHKHINDTNLLSHFVNMTQKVFSKNQLVLFKQINNCVDGEPIPFPRSGIRTSHILGDVTDETSDITVIRNKVDAEDLLVIMNKVKSNVGYIYILDERSTENQEESLAQQMKQNLPVVVFKQGEWGSYRPNISASNDTNNEILDDIELSLEDIRFNKSIETEYICVSNYEISSNSTDQTIGMGYAGVLNLTEKVMGLASMTSEKIPQIDAYLSWNIPENWSFVDAAVMPYIYSIAYDILFCNCYFPEELRTILINMGTESLITEACLNLSLHHGLQPYVSVSNDTEADIIKDKFPQLPVDNIFNREKNPCMYEIEIMFRTKCRGVDIILNCVPGSKHLKACLNCLTGFGVYLDMTHINLISNFNAELSVFLKISAIKAVRNNITNLLKWSDEKKQKLKNYIQKYIDQGVIKPFTVNQRMKNICATTSSNLKVIKMNSCNYINHLSRIGMKYDNKHSYLIISGRTTNKHWFELVEWLTDRGARKFMVALENFNVGPKISHQINRFLTQTKATIVLTAASKLDHLNSAGQLIEELMGIAPLEAIFYVSLNSADVKICNLDSLVPFNVHFVGLSSGGLKQFEKRRSRGAPAALIYSEKISSVFPVLDDLLMNNVNNNSSVLFEIMEPTSHISTDRITFPLRDFLPDSLDKLKIIGDDISNGIIDFAETSSLSLRYEHTKGVYPIFILPAIHGSLLQPLIRRLMYPVFCSTPIVFSKSVTDIANKLYKSLNVIQPSGPLTIISETWNFPIGLELVTLAEQAGRKYKLFALEGDPNDWRQRFDCLGTENSQQFDSNLLEEIFHFDNKIENKLRPATASSFEILLKAYIENISTDYRSHTSLISAAKLIRNIISQASMQQQLNNMLLKNVILIQRKIPTENSIRMSISSKVVIVDEKHYNKCFLLNSKVAKTVNKGASYCFYSFHK